MSQPLRGRRALITGASSGLGVEFARQLAAMGTDLVLVARREAEMQALAEQLSKRHGVSAHVVAMDLSKPDAAQTLVNQINTRQLDIDILLNNAGYGMHGTFEELDAQRQRDMLQLNIITLTELTQLLLPAMKARHFGHIGLIGSIGSFQPAPLYSTYAASKAYVLSLGEALDFELRGSGVNCTVICPGVTRTEFLDTAGQKPTLYQQAFLMDADEVVREGIEAMLAGQTTVVTGWRNKAQIFGLRFFSRKMAALAGYYGMKAD